MPESKAGRIPILAKKHICWPEKDNQSEFPEKRFSSGDRQARVG
ncbi:MAG TPA: hypothetical protein VEC95_06020 [Terriglobales bacterium]|nr:hypothetical protein [Terriglobales bacterium]